MIGVTLSPPVNLFFLYRDLAKMPRDMVDLLGTTVFGDMVLTLVFVAAQVLVAVTMHRRSRLFPVAYKWLFVAIVVYAPVDMVWVAATIADATGQEFVDTLKLGLKSQIGPQWLVAVVVTGGWLVYVRRSRRVANTFVE